MTPDIDSLRAYIHENLPRREAHILGCEQCAVEMALRFGADAEKARIAALLHDITKYESTAQQLNLLEKYSIMANHDADDFPQILHAYTAAGVARHEYGLDDEICGAIYWHTVGHAGMTKLEKIIYLADMIEPTRSYPGVEALREKAKYDLDGALLDAFAQSMRFILDKRGLLHPSTAEAYNDLWHRIYDTEKNEKRRT